MSPAPESPRRLSAARKAWRFLCLLAQPRLARKLGTLVTEGYLAQTGWVRSVLSGEIVGADGEPVPWMTRSFIDFIAPRLNPKMRVFEYGAGASTLFYALHVGEVLAVEHDARFAARLRPRLPANARVCVCPERSEDYANAIAQMENAPNLVSIDGLDRVRCLTAALKHATSDAVIVFDDTQLPEYAQIYRVMRDGGFRALDFWGLAAMRVEYRSTTVFYRPDNGLGI